MHEDSADVACEEVLENCVRGFRGRWKGDVPMASVSDPSARAIMYVHVLYLIP